MNLRKQTDISDLIIFFKTGFQELMLMIVRTIDSGFEFVILEYEAKFFNWESA